MSGSRATSKEDCVLRNLATVHEGVPCHVPSPIGPAEHAMTWHLKQHHGMGMGTTLGLGFGIATIAVAWHLQQQPRWMEWNGVVPAAASNGGWMELKLQEQKY
eukprot:scaffold1698_cov394-Pavlova_lutheri.AAC.6